MRAVESFTQIAPTISPPVPKPQWAHSNPQSCTNHDGHEHLRQVKPLIRVGLIRTFCTFAVAWFPVVVIFSLPVVFCRLSFRLNSLSTYYYLRTPGRSRPTQKRGATISNHTMRTPGRGHRQSVVLFSECALMTRDARFYAMRPYVRACVRVGVSI